MKNHYSIIRTLTVIGVSLDRKLSVVAINSFKKPRIVTKLRNLHLMTFPVCYRGIRPTIRKARAKHALIRRPIAEINFYFCCGGRTKPSNGTQNMWQKPGKVMIFMIFCHFPIDFSSMKNRFSVYILLCIAQKRAKQPGKVKRSSKKSRL